MSNAFIIFFALWSKIMGVVAVDFGSGDLHEITATFHRLTEFIAKSRKNA